MDFQQKVIVYKLLEVVKVAVYNFTWFTLVRWHTFHRQRNKEIKVKNTITPKNRQDLRFTQKKLYTMQKKNMKSFVSIATL